MWLWLLKYYQLTSGIDQKPGILLLAIGVKAGMCLAGCNFQPSMHGRLGSHVSHLAIHHGIHGMISPCVSHVSQMFLTMAKSTERTSVCHIGCLLLLLLLLLLPLLLLPLLLLPLLLLPLLLLPLLLRPLLLRPLLLRPLLLLPLLLLPLLLLPLLLLPLLLLPLLLLPLLLLPLLLLPTYLPVVPHKAVAEVSKIGNPIGKGWLL